MYRTTYNIRAVRTPNAAIEAATTLVGSLVSGALAATWEYNASTQVLVLQTLDHNQVDLETAVHSVSLSLVLLGHQVAAVSEHLGTRAVQLSETCDLRNFEFPSILLRRD
jgi:hypothetical protein